MTSLMSNRILSGLRLCTIKFSVSLNTSDFTHQLISKAFMNIGGREALLYVEMQPEITSFEVYLFSWTVLVVTLYNKTKTI